MPNVRAEIKTWEFVDLDASGRSSPDDPSDFYELLLVGIAPEDSQGLEWFDFIVCTPTAISRIVREAPGYVFGRFMLILNEWDTDLVVAAVRDLCDSAPDGDWELVSDFLSRFGMYEYERFRRGPDAARLMPNDSSEP
jgi:hypothetical protein